MNVEVGFLCKVAVIIQNSAAHSFRLGLLIFTYYTPQCTFVYTPLWSRACRVELTITGGYKYILDLAGAQHDQGKPVLPSREYFSTYTTKSLARRPIHATCQHSKLYLAYRHKSEISLMAVLMHNSELQEFVEDKIVALDEVSSREERCKLRWQLNTDIYVNRATSSC